MCLLVTPWNKVHKAIARTGFAHERQWSLIACICRRLSEELRACTSSTAFYNHTWDRREKDTTHFLISQQVTPAGELASHAGLSCRKKFKSCKLERLERCVSLHGNSILGKCAMTVIVNRYFTILFCCPDQYLGDLNLYSCSFSSLFFLKELNFFQ